MASSEAVQRQSPVTPSRRAVLQGTLLAAIAGGQIARGFSQLRAADKVPAVTKRSGLLVQPEGLSLLRTRSKLVLELEGELQMDEPDPKKKVAEIRKAEVKGKSSLDYFETIAFASDTAVAAARLYNTATSENWVSGKTIAQELRPDCSETRVLLHAGTWEQYCPTQPLDAREVELLRSPLNTLALELLLPTDPARPESNWTISKEAAKNLFNLEAVHRSTLTARVAKVEQGVATIEIEGVLDATANSVATTLDIKGNYHAKLGRECAFVSWVGLVIKEQREISQSVPGFEITARVRMIRAEADNELEVTHTELVDLVNAEDAGEWLVRLQSLPGRYSMLADRRWKTYIDGGEEAILRMIENNVVIAQCNVTQLTQLDEGTQLTLEAMQADIQKSLGESFGAFAESRERVTSPKLRQLRTVISGQIQEVPIQWIFNHLSDDQGRRVALEFTMGGNQIERFAAADEQMVASFEFLKETPSSSQEGPTSESPTPHNQSPVSVSKAPQKPVKTRR